MQRKGGVTQWQKGRQTKSKKERNSRGRQGEKEELAKAKIQQRETEQENKHVWNVPLVPVVRNACQPRIRLLHAATDTDSQPAV